MDSLIHPNSKGVVHVVAENHTGYTACLEQGTEIGIALPGVVVKQKPSATTGSSVVVNAVCVQSDTNSTH